MEGQCPDSGLGVFGQHVTNVITDGVVDGIVVGAGSSAALQPISGQGAIPATIPSQFLLSITVLGCPQKGQAVWRGRRAGEGGGGWERARDG